MGIRSVVIDTREPEWIQNLPFYGAEKTISYLDAGDLLVVCDDGAGLLIERKTPSDFINSLVSERMLIQSALKLAPYRDRGFWCYVMITGEFFLGKRGEATYRANSGFIKETKVDFTSVWGELLSIQELGVFVTFAKNDMDYEPAVLRLANRSRGELKNIPAAKRKGVQLGREATILESLPGIGDKRAKEILKTMTPIGFITALAKDEKPAGISGKVRERILLSLGIDCECKEHNNDN